MAELIGERLSGLRHESILATDGKDAWQRFSESGFDLVITDIRMPRLDGPGLIGRIRAAGSAIPILVETSDLGSEGVGRAAAAGASECFDFADLLRRLPEILDRWLKQ